MLGGPLDVDGETRQAPITEELLEGCEIHSQVGHGSQEEIAADSTDGLQKKSRAHGSLRAMSAAVKPPPKPLSMLTTLTLAAQLVSIPSKADNPPSCAP